MPLAVVIDFDSTVVQVEALDELAGFALEGAPDRELKLAQIKQLTHDAMNGKIGFGEALTRRLQLFSARPDQLAELIALLKSRVTPSFRDHIAEIRQRADSVYIVSGGFREYIVPVVADYGIAAEQVLGNTFICDAAGMVVGCDQTNPLSRDNGKVTVIRGLDLPGRVMMVGDGYSDLQVAKDGAAEMFVAFVENARRSEVVAEADQVAENFGDVVKLLK